MKMFVRFTASLSFAALALVGLLAQQASHSQPAKPVHPLKLPHPTKEIVQPTVLTKHELYSEDHTADAQAVDYVFSAYTFANDTHNGPLAASLFTEDAIIHFV